MLGRNTYLHHPRSVVDLDGVEIFLHHQQYLHHHHQQQPDAAFSGLYLAANAAAPSGNDNNNTLFSHETGEPSAVGNTATVAAKKQTAKRDRHSKIHTAQGPRDRRVRLSIAIARKFFDLQEMLGFDKPSKTLDWLLTKSRAAIKELVQKHQSSTSSPSACEELTSIDNGGGDSKRKLKEPQQAAMSIAKESRAKARARARERTLEKMCIKQQLGGEGCSGSDLNPSSSFDQCRNNDQLEFLQLPAAADGFRDPIYHFTSSNEAAAPAAAQDLIEESIVIKQRKHKNPPNSLLGFQQNLVLNSNYIFPNSSANANQNWDVFGLNSQSHLHAVYDQHKFFNSNANI